MKKIILTSLILSAISFAGVAQPWYEVSVPTTVKLRNIDFASNSVGYIIGDSTTLLKTTDGGVNWIKLNPTRDGIAFSTEVISDLHFVSETIGYMMVEGGMNGTLKTSDGGLTWTSIPNNQTNQCFPSSIYAFAEDDLMVGGSDCFQGATINKVQGGIWTNQTVNYQTFNTDEYVKDFDFEGNLGVAALNSEFVLRSIDFGATWDSVSVGLSAGSFVTSVLIGNNDTIYAGYSEAAAGYGILFSPDNGVTWESDFGTATFFYPTYYGFCKTNSGKIYCGAQPSNSTTGMIFKSQGGTFDYELVDHAIYALDSYGNDVTFAVGDSGYVLVNQPPGSLSVKENKMESAALNVYPNPVENQINWDCDNCSATHIRIVDLSGREVYSEVKPTENSIQISSLPTGIYTLEILSEDSAYTSKFIKK